MNFSIIIPTYNRASLLSQTLKQLKNLRYQRKKFEIIIVDNSSSDNTSRVVRKFKQNNPKLFLRYLVEKNQGRSYACNTGYRAAKNDHLIFLDDDVQVGKEFLNIYKKVYQAHPHAAVVGGKTIAELRQSISNTNKHFFLSLSKEYMWTMGENDLGNRPIILKYPQFIFAANISVNTRILNTPKKIFSESLGKKFKNIYLYAEDLELCLRLHLEKYIIIYEPLLTVKNVIDNDRLNYTYIFRRYLVAGIERYILDQKLRIYSEHIRYQFNFSQSYIISTMKHGRFLNKYFWTDQVCSVCTFIGYYILGPVYLSYRRVSFIFEFL